MTVGVLVIGAGGHAKVVIEAARAAGHHVVGLIAPDPVGTRVLGAAVLGDDDILARLHAGGLVEAVVALGDNRRRDAMQAVLQSLGYALPPIVHPTAWLSPSARLGAGTVVLQQAAISAEAMIGCGVIINSAAVVEHDAEIGDFAHVAPGVALAGRVRIGARSLVGVGSAVRPGVAIGADVVVGAGSVVVADVADGLTVVGCPARPLGKPA